MLSEKQIQSISKKLRSKHINEETQDYVLKYCQMNDKLFSDFIDIDSVIDRVTDNLNDNIKYNLPVPIIKGIYNIRDKKINLERRFDTPNKTREAESTIFHELDHCATRTEAEYTNNQKDNFYKYFNMVKKVPIIGRIATRYEKNFEAFVNSKKPITGVMYFSKHRFLNEGITAFKQAKYDKELNIPQSETPLYNNKSGYHKIANYVYQIADIIGEDNLLKAHFNNDFDDMSDKFDSETLGVGNLEEISKLMDKSVRFNYLIHPITTKRVRSEIDKKLNICNIANKCKEANIAFDIKKYESLDVKQLKKEMQLIYKNTRGEQNPIKANNSRSELNNSLCNHEQMLENKIKQEISKADKYNDSIIDTTPLTDTLENNVRNDKELSEYLESNKEKNRELEIKNMDNKNKDYGII